MAYYLRGVNRVVREFARSLNQGFDPNSRPPANEQLTDKTALLDAGQRDSAEYFDTVMAHCKRETGQ